MKTVEKARCFMCLGRGRIVSGNLLNPKTIKTKECAFCKGTGRINNDENRKRNRTGLSKRK